MNEIYPLIRIGLYILAGYLTGHGLPPQVADILTTDPAMIELVSNLLAGVVAVVSLAWWRLSKRLGWAT